MAASAVGVFAAYTASTAAPTTRYVVVRDDVVQGDRLTAADLALVPLELPPAQQRVSFSDVDVLVGATALGRLQAGQLVAASDVARPRGGDGRAQISLAVAPGNALNGDPAYLRGGELVDVIATFGEGLGAETRTVSRSAVVVEAFAGADAVGGSGAVTIVVAVPPADVEAVAQAAAAAEVSIARTTGLTRPGAAASPADTAPGGR